MFIFCSGRTLFIKKDKTYNNSHHPGVQICLSSKNVLRGREGYHFPLVGPEKTTKTKKNYPPAIGISYCTKYSSEQQTSKIILGKPKRRFLMNEFPFTLPSHKNRRLLESQQGITKIQGTYTYTIGTSDQYMCVKVP